MATRAGARPSAQIAAHAQTGSAWPRSSIGPISSTWKRPSVSRCAPGPIRIWPGSAACWRRAATFTASPVANVESVDSVTTSPDSTPIRAGMSTVSRIPSAALMARSASSSCACGTPNAAMTASPANFSTVPPWFSMHVETWSKNCDTRRRTTSGSLAWTRPLESTRSTNRTVASLRSMLLIVETKEAGRSFRAGLRKMAVLGGRRRAPNEDPAP